MCKGMNAERIVRKTIEHHGLISFGDHVVLGLSGGPDSLCLLHILTELRDELGFSLSCVHVNHLMRAEKATEDVVWLTAYCESLSIPLIIEYCDVRGFAKEEGISVEEAGRIARQKALFDCADKITRTTSSNVCIAFAHNRDDQAETVLMRLLRGTGIHGLAAMEYKRPDGIIRPLLDTPRIDIEAYCSYHNLQPRWDYTNASKEFTRNKLRMDLIPLLEREYNPSIKEGLYRLSNNAREDDEFLTKLAKAEESKAIFHDCLTKKNIATNACVEYGISDLSILDPAVGKRLIKLLFARLGLGEDITYKHLNSLWDSILRHKHGAVCVFPQNYNAEISYDKLVIYQNQRSKAVSLENFNWTLKQTSIPISQAPDPKSLSAFQRIFDAQEIQKTGVPLVLRTRRPGDYIRPMGSFGTKKLQDYFVDAKVERRFRDRCPIVCMGQDVVWIFEGPINDKYKLTENTKIVLLLELQQGIC
ncbi:MAG: tRNA lysidine(34) synthetase TilS [Clostridia bacterium]|nr:tRNA lysidine(34) synthetase TilS [Clostridia bacterium]